MGRRRGLASFAVGHPERILIDDRAAIADRDRQRGNVVTLHESAGAIAHRAALGRRRRGDLDGFAEG